VLVSFVIPLFNCLPLTQAMLASLQSSLPPGLEHEIIFVDDGSTDGTRDWLATLPEPRFRVLLNPRNAGYAAANNRGVALAQGEFLALLNNDLILQPGWFEPLLAAARKLGNHAGLIGNIQLDARTGAVDHAGLELTPTGKPVHVRHTPPRLLRRLQPVRAVPAVTGACVLLRHALWRQLAGFDEGYVNGGEDIDLCYRARALGCTNVVVLASVVRHHVSSSPGRKARDEHNSRRLARAWQHEFSADSLRPWCRDYLAHALASPRSRDYQLVLVTLAYLLRLRDAPPPEAVQGVREGLEREFTRWASLLGD
jgi:glycosyltransferase involved in cell wall biosynthesis